MLTNLMKRSFSSFNPTPQGGFNILGGLNRLKSSLKAPIKHIKRLVEPTGVNYQRMTNTTEEAFDEVSHEWQALVTHNPFDVQVFNYLENVQSSNFGTVDNPLVIFSSEVPFRYVGCTGQMNEDDYEGHELLFFMLREGPLQRCPQCGQVFKLIRLRNEYSSEMDYYMSSFNTYDMIEMGEADMWTAMSIAKYGSHHEYTQFETPSNMVYSLINPDDHDRVLVDPAYRIEKTYAVEQIAKAYNLSLREVDRKFIETNGPLNKIPISKVDYSTLIDVEKAITKLDRRFRQVTKFQSRKFLDRDNHERREKRMNQLKQERWDNNYTVFFGDLTEEEQQYRDYFQTDLEKNPEDEAIEEQIDEALILTRGDYNPNKYDFQESYTRNPEDDQTSLIEKIAFDFKYRLAKDKLEDYKTRQIRMITRQVERFNNSDYAKNVSRLNTALQRGDSISAQRLEKSLIDFVTAETKQQIKDYYEDSGRDLSILDLAAGADLVKLVGVFENHAARPTSESSRGFSTIPKRAYDYSQGLWSNFVDEFNSLNQDILPKARKLINDKAASNSLPLSVEELASYGLNNNQQQTATHQQQVSEAPKQVAQSEEAPKQTTNTNSAKSQWNPKPDSKKSGKKK